MIPSARNESPKCPVCQARFRGSGTCSRCGADLQSLMLLMAKAYQLREDARRALQAGDHERAQKLALEAQGTCSTQKGEDLRLLSSWLLRTLSYA
jgi:predicted amidophosphoribosyltransferase